VPIAVYRIHFNNINSQCKQYIINAFMYISLTTVDLENQFQCLVRET
jgi:hypothetical protein